MAGIFGPTAANPVAGPPMSGMPGQAQITYDPIPYQPQNSGYGYVPPQAPAPAWGGGELPQGFWTQQGLQAADPNIAPHHKFSPVLGAYQGDIRLAARRGGFEGAFGGGRLQNWARQEYGGWDPLVEQANRIQAERDLYNREVYGIDPSRWNPQGVVPSQIDPSFGMPRGIVRRAERNLGFAGDYGGGRETAFLEQEGMRSKVQQELDRMTKPQPYEQRAFVPNYSTFFNPFNFLSGTAQPGFQYPWYFSSSLGGAGEYMQPFSRTQEEEEPEWFRKWREEFGERPSRPPIRPNPWQEPWSKALTPL